MHAFAEEPYVGFCHVLDDALDNGISNLSQCVELPYMNEGYIPQGIHITGENLAYVSMYHKDVDGVRSKNSIVAEIDLSSKKSKKYILPIATHVGGLAIFDKYSKFVIPYELTFCVYEKENLKDIPCQTQSVGSSLRTTGFSFINYAPDHDGDWHMWAGQFHEDSASPNDGDTSNDGMHIFGYEVKSGVISTVPSYRFYVPSSVDKIQGATIIAPSSKSGEYKILVTSSYGDHPSKITLLKYKREESYYYKYKYKSYENVYTAPAGLEEIHATANSQGVWALFESGSQYYDYKWSSKGMPFMYRIPFHELGLYRVASPLKIRETER